jgi:DNA-binding transcriptional ArsR family regulator
VSNDAITWAYRQQTRTSGAKFVLVVLADFADEAGSCFPGQALLAERTGQGERTVRRQVIELEEAGLIAREHRYDREGQRTSDRYRLQMATGQNDRKAPEAALPANGDRLPAIYDSTTGQDGRVTLRENPQLEPSDELHERRQSKAELFDVFYAAYPRHTGRQAARRAWDKAVRDTTPERLLAGAQRFAADPNRDPTYTPHPATWLNAGRWDDEPLPPRSVSPRPTAAREW